MSDQRQAPFLFPKWLDRVRPILGGAFAVVPAYVIFILYYGGSPETTDVGYQPVQPVPFSHALHAGELGMDCRYCHGSVDVAAHAAIPPTETCMNCHAKIRTQSEKLLPIRESYATGLPVHWVRVHDLPDFVYFNHSAHVTRGVGCVECHGRVDKMEAVYQAEPLSMAWCLDCHRDPEPHLRPVEMVTRMDWRAENQAVLGRRLGQEGAIHPSTDCSTCHR